MEQPFWQRTVTLVFHKPAPNDGLAFGGLTHSVDYPSMLEAVRKVQAQPVADRRYWRLEAHGVGELDGDQIIALVDREDFPAG